MATRSPNSCFSREIERVTARQSGCSRKPGGMWTSSGPCQIGFVMRTVGQLSFCSHCISQPRAEDSWMIVKYGEMLSNPSSVCPVAARRAFSSGSRHAAGNGASTRSISSTVARFVGLATGVRSTGLPARAFITRSRGVIVSASAITAPPLSH